MNEWFTVERIDDSTFCISEYKHWEQPHCYLLCGDTHSLLIDTGLGIQNISRVVKELTDKPVIAVATHVHWDHIGGHWHFPVFYAHEAELSWLNGEFPRTMEQVRGNIVKDCDLPKDFDVESYEIFQGTPERCLADGDIIDIGGRRLEVLHTPGHSPGHMCFYERKRGYLFTGDLIYSGELYAFYTSTDPVAYLESVQKVAALPIKKVLPAHEDIHVPTEIVADVERAFLQLRDTDKLRHGTGTHDFGSFSIII